MRMQHLRFFAAVVDEGSITRAARRLNATQPVLSVAIQGIERELRRPLFERVKGRKLLLTAEGRAFYDRVTRILGEYEAARAELAGKGAPRRLRLGVMETVATAQIAALADGLRASGWRVEIWQGGPEKIAGWLRQKRVDAAWTSADGDGGSAAATERFLCVAAKSHPTMQGGATLTVAGLAAEPFVLRQRCERSAAGEEMIRSAGYKLRVVARAANDDLAFELVRRGLGLTLAPASLVPDDLAARPVRGFRLERTLAFRAATAVGDRALPAIQGLRGQAVRL